MKLITWHTIKIIAVIVIFLIVIVTVVDIDARTLRKSFVVMSRLFVDANFALAL